MQLDPLKVKATLNQLNKTKDVWIQSQDLFALTRVEIDAKNNANFFPASGMPAVVFINTETGEIRPYHIGAFSSDEK